MTGRYPPFALVFVSKGYNDTTRHTLADYYGKVIHIVIIFPIL